MILQFEPFSSTIDVTFWYTLSKYKLDVYKLDDSSKPLTATYTSSLRGQSLSEPARLTLSSSSFESQEYFIFFIDKSFILYGRIESKDVIVNGILRNLNTMEQFKESDKNELLFQQALSVCFSKSCDL